MCSKWVIILYSCQPLINELTMFCEPAPARSWAIPSPVWDSPNAAALAGAHSSSNVRPITVVEWNRKAPGACRKIVAPTACQRSWTCLQKHRLPARYSLDHRTAAYTGLRWVSIRSNNAGSVWVWPRTTLVKCGPQTTTAGMLVCFTPLFSLRGCFQEYILSFRVPRRKNSLSLL